ncbi:cytochrome c3 family protein [Aliagarivorans marinus]|uniref:cytochrome c3 family protein n=1 Tax=Aliagarivorans marinus TaxID=561965 RepID=UPI000413C07C|nr:cytochrome c3 family protein [Aliagarivorans marinus]
MKRTLWLLWSAISIAIASYYAWSLVGPKPEARQAFIVGAASHGHYQIELACESCHSSAFGGPEVLQDACMSCHGAELEAAHDSHPKSKFTDPRNADRLAIIDARYCSSCHLEHQQEQTLSMGLTLPADFCFECHQDIAEERPSHQDLAFDSCASAGCHNYHDNRALYQDFLIKHAGEPALLSNPSLPITNHASLMAANLAAFTPTLSDAQMMERHPAHTADWLASAHANAEVSCSACHQPESETAWQETPEMQVCANCHQQEQQGFFAGKHGMRLKAGLSPMTPAQSSLDFHAEAADSELSCGSCHEVHRQDRQAAAVEACLDCHNDSHSQHFLDSPHGQLWLQAQAGDIPAEQAVSCASCHLPRIEQKRNGQMIVSVQHNQNDNLRPNEKMIRPVCSQCHGVGFAIDALADPQLIRNNFSTQPSKHVVSIDWALGDFPKHTTKDDE